ncbi:MAG: polysaccharide biosynthesis C-terminal domain-containing protein [Reichenbachiella sp.]
MSELKGLVSDTVWYGLSSIIGRMFSYFLVPLYTMTMLPAEYGIVTELYADLALYYVLYTYGMETAYFRFANKDIKETEVFNLTLSSIITTSLFFSACLVAFSTEIVNLLNYEGKEIAIYYLAGIIAIDAIVAIPYSRLRLQNKAKKFAFIKLFQIVFTLALNLFFYILCVNISKGIWFPSWAPTLQQNFDLDFLAQYAFLSNLIANAAVLLLLTREIHGFKFSFDFKKLKPLLIYGLPLLVMGLAGVTNEMLSRKVLKFWLPDGYYPGISSQAALGIFGACYKISVFMMLGNQAFRYAAEPFFFSKADKKDSPQLFSKIMDGFIAFNTIVFLAVSVNLQPIANFFILNKIYHQGLVVVPFLLLGYLFNGIYYNLSVWYKLTDKTRFGAIITSVGAIATIGLNFLLIPIYGYTGSAIATLITFFGMAISSYLLGQKHYPIPYQVSRAMEFITVSTLLVLITYPMQLDNWLLDMAAKNMIVLLYMIYIYYRQRKLFAGKVILGIKFP